MNNQNVRSLSPSRRALAWHASLSRLRVSATALAGLTALAFGAPSALHAQNSAWSTTPANGNFTGTNWTPGTTPTTPPTGTIAAGDNLYFGTSNIVALNNDEAIGFSIGSFTFISGASAFTIGGNSFALGVGGITNSSTSLQTINAAFTLAATSTFTTTTGGGNIALGGIISGAGGFTVAGSGTGALTLNNYSTFAGGTTVNGGTLTLNRGGGAGAVQGVVTVNIGATLNLTAGDALGYTSGVQISTINVNRGAVTSSSGNQGYLTSFNLTGGTVSGTSLFRFNVDAASAPTISSVASATTSTFASNIDSFRGSGGTGNLGISVALGTVPSGVDLTISGGIISGGGITKSGPGYLNLTNNGSTFSGPVVINGGTVNVGTFGADAGTSGVLGLSNAGKTITVNTGSTLSGTTTNWFGNQGNTGTLPVITVNSGTLTTNNYTAIGAVTLNGATMSNTAGNGGNYQSFALRSNITVGGSALSTISSTTGGGIHLGANTLFTVADAVNGVGTDLTVSAPLINQSGDFGSAAGGFTKAGPGTMLLSASNTYTGATTVSAGTLAFGAGGSVYTNATLVGAITVGSGGTLRFDTNDSLGGSTSNSPVVVTITSGTLASNNSYTSLNNPVFNGATITDNGGASGGFNAFRFAGTVLVSGSAATNINAGTTNASSGINLGGNFVGTTTTTFDVRDATGNANSDLNVNVAVLNTNTGSGVISALTKIGGGTMTLNAANTYTGPTTINAGNLVVTGSTAAASAVTVNNTGSTLSGTGTVAGTVTVGSGSIISAGNKGLATPTPGTLTTGALTLLTGSTFDALLASSSSFSKLSASGTTTLSNAAFSISLAPGATFANNTVLTLITSNVTGQFTNSVFTTGGYNFTADYTTNAGFFDVNITPVPEPATWAAGCLLFGLVGVSQRRKISAAWVAARGC